METPEVLLKADKVAVVFERLADGKIRVTASSWDDAKVILPNQVLEAAMIGKQVEECLCQMQLRLIWSPAPTLSETFSTRIAPPVHPIRFQQNVKSKTAQRDSKAEMNRIAPRVGTRAFFIT